jgi:predicted HAD superfamily phosphohydrolase
MANNFIAFNLEGPLSLQDSAAELMKLFPSGDKIYIVISRYRELKGSGEEGGREPDHILSLIIPFLVLHKIQEDQIIGSAANAPVTGGAANLISQLEYNSWKIFCLTSACEQYALHFTHQFGIYAHHTISTPLPLNEMIRNADKKALDLILQTEREMQGLTPGSDDLIIKRKLEAFYGEELPQTNLGPYLNLVKPPGSQRKLEALKDLATRFDQPLSGWVMIGSGLEDVPALQAVNRAGGLAIAFNADKAALSSSLLAMASTSIADFLDVALTWQKGGLRATERLVREKERIGGRGQRGHFHWLPGKADISPVIEIHQRLKLLTEEEATKAR